MQAQPSASAPERPGKTSMWTHFKSPRERVRDAGGSTVPLMHSAHGIGALDAVRSAFWQAYRHLFPPHSLAAQNGSGALVISWSVQDEPEARYPYAAPVLLRFEDHLLDLMWRCDSRQRRRIAEHHEAELKAGMRGYDPYARIPNARIITIG
jgi:hypothetical protein